MTITLIADLETAGFHGRPHCLFAACIETGDEFHFVNHPNKNPKYHRLHEGVELLRGATRIIGHNWLAYDGRVLEKHCGLVLVREQIKDTLVASRLAWPDMREADMENPNMPAKLYGRHSLEAWGHRLGVLKGAFAKTTDWQHWTPAMSEYCARDTIITAMLYDHILDHAVTI